MLSLTDRANQMTEFLNAGLVYRGLFRARPQDSTGLGLAIGGYGDPYYRGLQAAGQGRKDHEAVIELNHRFALRHGIAIQPDLQSILRPGGAGDIDNALVIGAKISMDF